MLMFHRGLQFFKALLRERSHVNLIIAPCGEEGSLLLPDFLDQEPKMEPDEVVLPRSCRREGCPEHTVF